MIVLFRDWAWIADADWIDFVATAYIGYPNCYEGSAFADIAQSGRVTFSAAGNGEGLGPHSPPSGHPLNYIVGGTDDAGRTYTPASPGASNVAVPDRPYDSGHLYESIVADADSFDGSVPASGTSFSAPRTAGDAAVILRHARTILGSYYTGARDGALARLGPEGRRPEKGPLADGDFTRAELIDLLHAVAVPFEAPSPGRYLIEGYGAMRPQSVELAKAVLDGRVDAPQRPEEDQAHAAVNLVRQGLFPPGRCEGRPDI